MLSFALQKLANIFKLILVFSGVLKTAQKQLKEKLY